MSYAKPDRPNVLLICTDHLSGLIMGNAGHPVVMTPTLDHLARCGTTFTNAYSACPSYIPARRSLMTGMSPRANGLRYYQEDAQFPDCPTLAQCFRDAGYQAYAVGKLHVWPAEESNRLRRRASGGAGPAPVWRCSRRRRGRLRAVPRRPGLSGP